MAISHYRILAAVQRIPSFFEERKCENINSFRRPSSNLNETLVKCLDLGVSKISGTPKSSILIGFSDFPL